MDIDVKQKKLLLPLIFSIIAMSPAISFANGCDDLLINFNNKTDKVINVSLKHYFHSWAYKSDAGWQRYPSDQLSVQPHTLASFPIIVNNSGGSAIMARVYASLAENPVIVKENEEGEVVDDNIVDTQIKKKYIKDEHSSGNVLIYSPMHYINPARGIGSMSPDYNVSYENISNGLCGSEEVEKPGSITVVLQSIDK